MKKNINSEVIVGLCSFLCLSESVKPYESSEWSNLAEKLLANNMQPLDLLNLSDDDYKQKLLLESAEIMRIKRLFDRMGSLSFAINKFEDMGIKIVTRADKTYPIKIKKMLQKTSPPLFYYTGDIEIANDDLIGFVGSRKIDAVDIAVTERLVKSVTNNGFSIVSGGAKGVDETSTEHALSNGKAAVEILSDSLVKRIKNPLVNRAIREGRLVVISAAKPDAPFNVGMAMARNKYIYAASKATIVIRSEYNKGGTWAGATEALRQKYAEVYCWKNDSYQGNTALIQKGAKPIGDIWDGSGIQEVRKEQQEQRQQITLFNYLGNKDL